MADLVDHEKVIAALQSPGAARIFYPRRVSFSFGGARARVYKNALNRHGNPAVVQGFGEFCEVGHGAGEVGVVLALDVSDEDVGEAGA